MKKATTILGLLILLGVCSLAWAQFTSGTILGTISDPSAAAVPGAQVTATNLDTGFVRTVETSQAGDYMMSNMPLGKYQIKAEAEGFKTAVVGPVTLIVDQKLRSDFKLSLGAIAQVVEVTGIGATLLQTDQSDINQIVEQKQITGLPLNGRDFFSLLLLSNGLQDTSNDQGGATTNVTFSVNGMRPEANSVTLDGIEMSSVRESDVDMRPNIDAISEFKVLTSAFSAEYGHTAGGVISIQSRAGTNAFHGNVFEFLRNDALNAANFFRNPVDPTKAPLKQNMFGGTIGGPIIKNKTFYFADYSGYRLGKINEAFGRVPEVPFRDGDFSSLLAASYLLDPSPLEVVDPNLGYPAGLYDTPTYAGIYDPATGLLFRDPSRATPENPQGLNIIPRQRFNQFGWALMNGVALPNLPNDYPLGNYFVRQSERYKQDEAGIRVDHSFSTRDNLFVRYRWNDGFLNTADPLARPDGPMPGIGLEVGDDSRGIIQGGTHRDRNSNLVVSEVHIFNSQFINEARVGFHRYRLDVFQHAYGMNLAEKFGLQGVNVGPDFSGLPIVYLDDYNSLGGDDWKPLFFRETSFQINDNVTYMRGKHALKMGFEFRPRDENNYYTIFPAGAFWSGNIYTSWSGGVPFGWYWQGGHPLADVLLGIPGYGYHGRRFGSPDLKDRQYSFFLQDDWKVTDRLTLNLGVRYEYATPFFSPKNEMALFDPGLQKMLIAGKDGVSRYIVEPDRNNWAPRVGLAYKLNPKTTLRAGFGVFYDPENAKRDDIKFNPPFYREYSTDPYLDAYPDDPSQFSWSFWSVAPPDFTDPGSFPKGYTTHNTALNLRTGYSEQYSFAVQRELPAGMLLEAAYVGSQAHKLPYGYNLNPNPIKGLARNNPDLGDLYLITGSGNMIYHSGQFKLERRFGKNLFFLTSYTWSKSIDNVSSANFDSGVSGGVQNIYDPRANRGVSDWDVPHRLAFSYIYDLPYGKGRQFGAQAHPVLRAIAGDWQMSGIFVASSGVPGTVTVGDAIPGGDARPDLIGNPNLPGSERSPDLWFNTDAFVKHMEDGQLAPGNAGRNIFRGPRYTNLDLGIGKFFNISERVRLQFRTEFFNLSNTPHFSLPVRSMKDPAFGRITHTRNPVNFGSSATSYSSRMIQFALKLEF
ncbi:MAG: TonB-dependent receptor domain-containing protein [Terriglobia bacterium]